MSDFNIDIDTSALVTALKSLDGLGDGWARMVTKVVSENKRMDSAVQQSIKSQLEAKTRLQAADAKTNSDAAFARDRRKIQMMDASAAMSRKQAREAEVAANAVVKASNEVVIAANREAREQERLKVKYKEGYAATALYNSIKAELAQASILGAITTDEEAESLQRLTAEYNQFANGGAAAGNRFAGAAVGATRRMSSMGVVTQQVGYQVGDFAVQVQSGQSALVAFSQQATQLVGVLPLLSDSLGISAGKLIGISAVLGIAIPVVTALANVLFTAGGASEDAADGVETFEDSLKTAREEVKGMKEDLRLMNSGFDTLSEFTLDEAVKRAKESVDEIRALLSDLNTFSTGGAGLGVQIAREGDLAVALEELAVLREIQRQTEQRNRDESITNQLHEVRQTQQAEAYEAGRKAYEDRVEQTRNILSIMGQVNSEATELTQSTIDMAKELGFSYEETVKLQEELEKAEDYALGITDADMASGIMDAAAQAAVLATNMGITLGLALKLQDIAGKSQEENLFDAQVTAGIIPPWASNDFNLSGGGETPLALQGYVDAVDGRVAQRAEDSRGTSGGGSGGSQAADKLDFVQALEAEMAVRGELVKLYGDEYELQSEIARIVKGLGEDSGDYNAQSIEALAQQNLLLIEQENLREESVKQMQNVYDMLGNEMGTAFTSMIDGTKSVEDAFKSMAKNIIDQLIQIFIIEQMVNSITGGLGGGGGSLKGLTGGGGGSKVKFGGTAAAGGPIDGGKSYLVGESGPELIIPRDNSEVINNKHLKQMQGGNGSGGDNVVIHQNFNFQANGDDTVKRLIQQAAPQIAQMTKSSMLNDRRRGGQTKSVFG